MTLPDVIESSERREESGAATRGPLRDSMVAQGYRVRSGPHVNQLDRDAIEDRGLPYFAIADDPRTRAIEAVMPS